MFEFEFGCYGEIGFAFWVELNISLSTLLLPPRWLYYEYLVTIKRRSLS